MYPCWEKKGEIIQYRLNPAQKAIGWQEIDNKWYYFDENVDKETVKVLVGNKIDIGKSREVNLEQMKALGEKYKMEVFEASAKTGVGVPEIFTYLVSKLLQNPKIGEVMPDDESTARKNSQALNKNTFKERKKHSEECNC